LAYKALTAAAFGTWHSTPNSRGKLNNKFMKSKPVGGQTIQNGKCILDPLSFGKIDICAASQLT